MSSAPMSAVEMLARGYSRADIADYQAQVARKPAANKKPAQPKEHDAGPGDD